MQRKKWNMGASLRKCRPRRTLRNTIEWWLSSSVSRHFVIVDAWRHFTQRIQLWNIFELTNDVNNILAFPILLQLR